MQHVLFANSYPSCDPVRRQVQRVPGPGAAGLWGPAVRWYRVGRRCDENPHQEEHHHPLQGDGDVHHRCGQPAGYFDSGLRRRTYIDQEQRKFTHLVAIAVETSYNMKHYRNLICMWDFANQCWISTFILRISCRTSSEGLSCLASLLHPGVSLKSKCFSRSMSTVSSTYQLAKRTRSPSPTKYVKEKLLMERFVSILVIFIDQHKTKKKIRHWIND